ncbi:class I SAM-dependent methyltransferase [Flavobacteriales bacterium]|jgi:SAM-dependent methyltransferase|nr:class I SAM-dependent methyltransferase [Flavobacteriales bacterium]
MNWYANWFNSHYYHILYNNRDEKEAEFFIDNLIKRLNLVTPSKLIDIACGKGRHATYFNTKGFDVTGVDLSQNSIEHAIRQSIKKKNLSFKVHDMRELYKANHFDVATNLFTSFGYFEDETDEQKAINSISQSLKANGLLIIDFMNVNKVVDNLVVKEQKIIQSITFNIKRKVEDHYIIKDIEILDSNKKYEFQEKVKALNLDRFTTFVNEAGLKIIDIFGNYSLDRFDTKKSNRLILICKK